MTTYYVSSIVGSDKNAGTSGSAPLASLQAAEALTKPGDTVEVMNGTYTGPGGGNVLTISTSGTASAPITFEAAPGATPVIDSSGTWQGIEIDASYITINGLTIVGDAANYNLSSATAGYSTGNADLDGNGIASTSGTLVHNLIIENNTVYNEPGGGITINDGDYLQILNNDVHDNAHWSAYGDSGISIGASENFDNGPGPHIIITGNTSVNNADLVPEYRAGAITDGEGIILDSNSGYTGGFLIQNNTTHGSSGPGIESFESDNAVITGNTTTGDLTNSGLVSEGEIFINQSSGNTVTGNITAAAPPPPPAGQLIVNGSFETHDFGGWTVGGNSGASTFGPQMFIDTTPENGAYAAALGSMGSDGTLSQTIATTAGSTYTLSFWLKNEGSDPNDFKATWNGQTLLSLANATQSGYTQYTYTVTATGAASTLQFAARNDPSQWDLDNISLTASGTSSAPPPPAAPTITGITDSPATGDLNAGKTVALMLGFSSTVTVVGKPTLTLNDGGTATYASGSGTNALTFNYTVAAGQNTASLAATAVNLASGVTIKTSAGAAANLSLTGLTQSGPQIDTAAPAAPVISSDTVSGNIVTLKGTAAANSTITVFDSSTKLGAATANSSGAWTFATGALASGSQSFTATATDAAGNVSPLSSALAVTLAVGSSSGGNLVTNGSFETDSFSGWTLGGNDATSTFGPQMFIDTTPENGAYAAALGSMGSDGTLSQTIATTAGSTYTLSFWLKNEGSDPNDFKATWNGQTLLSLANATQSGYTQYTYTVTATGAASTLQFAARNDPSQWDLDNISLTASGTSSAPPPPAAPTITGISDSPVTGDLNAGKTVALMLGFSSTVTVVGKPTLTLNDGGTATYASGSGTNALTFNYTVAAGQNTASLAATAVNLASGVTIKTSAGAAANLSLTGLTQSGPQIDTAAPAAPVISSDTVSGNIVTLKGTAAANSTITVFDSSTKLGAATANSSGAWTFATGALASGSQSFTATATDAAGNVSPLSSALAVTLAVGSSSGGNLVTNGSFETDSFSGWTLGGNDATSTFGPQMFIDTTPENGAYAAALGSMGSDGTLSQTIATTAGSTYTLSFWLKNEGSDPNDFKATWNGQTLLSLANATQSGYTQYTYTVTATGAASTLQFAARNDPSQWDLDNISLTASGTSSAPPPPAAPTITGISDSPVTGDLNAGKTVALMLGFSSTVTVVGKPTLTLNDGGTATYASGSGTNALTFNYTVAAGQNTASLAATAVNLASGVTIKTSAGAAANLSLTGLTQSGPQIDTMTPTVTSMIASPAKGDLNAGKTVTLTLNFSEPVTVAGKPTLTLNDGGTATYASGSGGKTLTFAYTVAAGQNVAALAATAINLASGVTIKDSAGNAANLSLAGLTQIGPQIDTTTPTITGISELPATADLGWNQPVAFTLTFSEPMTVVGRPTLTLNDGGIAYYQSGSSTNILTFYYHVGTGENTAALAATTVNLPSGAAINDSAGNPAKLSLTGFSQHGPQIDTTAPTVTSVTALPAKGDLNAGKTVTVTLNFSEPVTVAGKPTLTLNDGGTATYASGSGGKTLTFAYTVAAGQNVAALAATAINLASGVTIKDSAGNAANLSLAGLTQIGPQIDTTTPTITGISELPATADLGWNQPVAFTLTFSEPMTVVGRPTLTLNDGGIAYYQSGSSTNILTFYYHVGTGENTAALAATTVNLPSGAAINDSAGNPAKLSLTGFSQHGPQIDTTAPTVTSVIALPAKGDLNAGKTVTVTLNFSEPVTVAGKPTLTLNDGGTATYASGSGGKTLTFAYTVAAGQNVAALAATAINLASGVTIKDSAGNAANLSLAGLTQIGPQIDTTTPTITGISESPATADLGWNQPVAFTLTFSEPMTVVGRPTLTLNDGGIAYYQSGSSTNILTFYYHVGTGENTAALAATTVNLPSGAAINDSAGNPAKLSLTGFSQHGPQIDTTAPTVTSVTASPGTGTQLPGDPITITVKMSEAVTMPVGAPLLLNDLGTAAYVGGSGTNTLTFKYTVGANDKDVSALGILAIELPAGVTIKDGAGNNANMAGIVHSFAGLAVDPPIVTTKPGGSYDIAYSEMTGLTYSSYEDIFNSAGVQVAEARDMIGGAGTLILNADHLTVSSSSGSLGVMTGSDTFKANSHASESIIASGQAGETFKLGSGFGHESITGLLASGPSNDVIEFSVAMFKGLSSRNTATENWDALLSSGAAVQSGANVAITDAAHDVLTLNNVTTSMLSHYAGSVFKFV